MPDMQMGSEMADRSGSKAATKPVAAHPLFTAVVALWSGALLGLGTLAVHPALFASGLVRFAQALPVPAQTARPDLPEQPVLAAGMALLGCLVGLAIARLANRPHRAPPRSERSREFRQTMPREAAIFPENGPAANPATARRRQVLDISAIEFNPSAPTEPLDLALFLDDRIDSPAPIMMAQMPRPREETERTLRDALATLHGLRGAA